MASLLMFGVDLGWSDEATDEMLSHDFYRQKLTFEHWLRPMTT